MSENIVNIKKNLPKPKYNIQIKTNGKLRKLTMIVFIILTY